MRKKVDGLKKSPVDAWNEESNGWTQRRKEILILIEAIITNTRSEMVASKLAMVKRLKQMRSPYAKPKQQKV